MEALWNSPARTNLDINLPKRAVSTYTINVINIGNDYALGINVTFVIHGGILNKINVFGGSSISSLNAGETIQSWVKIQFGFGKITLTATARTVNAFEVEKTISGFILGPIIITK